MEKPQCTSLIECLKRVTISSFDTLPILFPNATHRGNWKYTNTRLKMYKTPAKNKLPSHSWPRDVWLNITWAFKTFGGDLWKHILTFSTQGWNGQHTRKMPLPIWTQRKRQTKETGSTVQVQLNTLKPATSLSLAFLPGSSNNSYLKHLRQASKQQAPGTIMMNWWLHAQHRRLLPPLPEPILSPHIRITHMKLPHTEADHQSVKVRVDLI